MSAIDMTKIFRRYKGKWVGLKQDRQTVVASGTTLREVVAKVERKGYKKPIYHKVPSKIIPLVGFWR